MCTQGRGPAALQQAQGQPQVWADGLSSAASGGMAKIVRVEAVTNLKTHETRTFWQCLTMT